MIYLLCSCQYYIFIATRLSLVDPGHPKLGITLTAIKLYKIKIKMFENTYGVLLINAMLKSRFVEKALFVKIVFTANYNPDHNLIDVE